jgi:hypothetical protein
VRRCREEIRVLPSRGNGPKNLRGSAIGGPALRPGFFSKEAANLKAYPIQNHAQQCSEGNHKHQPDPNRRLRNPIDLFETGRTGRRNLHFRRTHLKSLSQGKELMHVYGSLLSVAAVAEPIYLN